MRQKVILWILTVLWGLFIFGFSAQPAKESNQLSISVTKKVISALPGIRSMPAEEKTVAVETIHTFIRKLAHFVVYLIFGMLLMSLSFSYGFSFHRAYWIAFFAAVLYAASDELHQCFVPGRAGRGLDILIDSAGANLGILIVNIFKNLKTAVTSK